LVVRHWSRIEGGRLLQAQAVREVDRIIVASWKQPGGTSTAVLGYSATSNVRPELRVAVNRSMPSTAPPSGVRSAVARSTSTTSPEAKWYATFRPARSSTSVTTPTVVGTRTSPVAQKHPASAAVRKTVATARATEAPVGGFTVTPVDGRPLVGFAIMCPEGARSAQPQPQPRRFSAPLTPVRIHAWDWRTPSGPSRDRHRTRSLVRCPTCERGRT
jgi:hypothetical protein